MRQVWTQVFSSLATSPTKGRLSKVGRPQDVKDGVSAAVDVGATLLWVHVRLLLVESRLRHWIAKHLSRVLVPHSQNLDVMIRMEMCSLELLLQPTTYGIGLSG